MLKEGLEKLDFSAEQISFLEPKFEKYIEELQIFKSTCNSILGTDEHDEIVSRHILDSLAPYKIFCTMTEEILAKKGGDYKIEIADVGSGQGIPGIPLALAFPQIHFTLIERMTKRTAFLDHAVAALELKNVTVNPIEVERVKTESFDIVTFRAFSPFNKKMIKPLLKILKPNGNLAAYKATPEKINEEMASVSEWVKKWEMKKLSVPFMEDHQRNLVLVPKQ